MTRAGHQQIINGNKMIKKTKSTDIEIGLKIKEARIIAGKSQEQLGNIVGVTFQQIQKYENATNRVSASRLFYISKALNVNINYFFEKSEIANMNELSKDVVQLVKDYIRIQNPILKKQVVKFIKVIMEQSY